MACAKTGVDDKLLEKVNEFLHDVFKHRDFKSDIQKKAIMKILEGENDVFMCLPNGYGRALSYQLPAAMRAGLQATLIIYSEAERIHYHADLLTKLGIPCKILNEKTLPMNNYKILDDITNGTIRPCLLYVDFRVASMEKIEKLLSFLQEKNRLACVVVDETHSRQFWQNCKYQETYDKIGNYRLSTAEIPWVVVSSKIHPYGVESLKSITKLKTYECGFKSFAAPIFRPNIRYECVIDDNLATSYHNLKDFVIKQLTDSKSTDQQPVNGSGLIFCKNKDKCVEIATELAKSGIKITYFHYSLSLLEKERTIKMFYTGLYNVLAVTSYFERSIEKSDIRFIVHWGLPSSIMSYYSNTDLAGRDGNLARCRIYVTKQSLEYYEENRDSMLKYTENGEYKNENEKKKHYIFLNGLIMKDYCTSFLCRHAVLAEYFGDVPPVCIDKCDICVAINKGFCALKKPIEKNKPTDESEKKNKKKKSLTKRLADIKL